MTYTPTERRRRDDRRLKLEEVARWSPAPTRWYASERERLQSERLAPALRIAREHIDRCCTDRTVARYREEGIERALALGGGGRELLSVGGAYTRAMARNTPSGHAPTNGSAALTGTSRTMSVTFSPYGNWYEINSRSEGRFLERTALGCFDHAVRSGWAGVKSLFDHGHSDNRPLGQVTGVEETAHGARGTVKLVDAGYARDLAAGLQMGLYGSSFRFSDPVDEWSPRPGRSAHNPEGIPERTIRSVLLHEFGPVTYPANPAATATVF